MSKLTVKEAASKLNIGVQPLRLAIQQDKYDWGVAVKVGKNKYTYILNRERFNKYMGE